MITKVVVRLRDGSGVCSSCGCASLVPEVLILNLFDEGTISDSVGSEEKRDPARYWTVALLIAAVRSPAVGRFRSAAVLLRILFTPLG